MTRPGPSLDHWVIHESDWEPSNTFYRVVMGASLLPKGNRWEYDFGNVRLNVHGPGSDALPVACSGRSDHGFVWRATLWSAVEHLGTAGVETELGPEPRYGADGAGASLYSRDPGGSLLE